MQARAAAAPTPIRGACEETTNPDPKHANGAHKERRMNIRPSREYLMT